MSFVQQSTRGQSSMDVGTVDDFAEWPISISSSGGPLLCIETALAGTWGGVAENSLSAGPGSDLQNDYVRACAVHEYAGTIRVRGGHALVLGDVPLETLVWQRVAMAPTIVRVRYADPGVNVLRRLIRSEIQSAPDIEHTSLQVRSESVQIFDAAIPSIAGNRDALYFQISPGQYTILTKRIEPDSRTSLLIHEFVRML